MTSKRERLYGVKPRRTSKSLTRDLADDRVRNLARLLKDMQRTWTSVDKKKEKG